MDDAARIRLVAVVVVALVGLVLAAVVFRYFGLYVRAFLSGAPVTAMQLLGMSLRRVNPAAVVNARVMTARAGLQIPVADMEAHVLAGGNLERVAGAVVAARLAKVDLPWTTASAMDLAGHDVMEHVRRLTRPGAPR